MKIVSDKEGMRGGLTGKTLKFGLRSAGATKSAGVLSVIENPCGNREPWRWEIEFFEITAGSYSSS